MTTGSDSERPARRNGPSAPTARSVAARVLERVERDGAYAAAALDAELERYPALDARDRALATEIVYGVLRTRGALLSRIEAHAPRGVTDVAVRTHLLVAAYQLLLLDRVPAHAAVDAAVRAIKSIRGTKVSGFANAVLRKVAAGGPLSRDSAILTSAPAWLVAELRREAGEDEARALLGADAGSTEPLVAVRLAGAHAVPEWLASAEIGRVSPLARLVPRGGSLQRRPGFAEGAFVVQEEGAQIVALALGAREGERILDACAGRGQKTTLLRERVGPDAELWAADLYAEKLVALNREMERLGLRPASTAAVDLSVGSGGLPSGFDRVLVDAPCSGTGTLRHRPEILLRLTPEDPPRLGRLSEAILRRAAALAKPGGRVVFAVCSVLRAECEDVVERVGDVLAPAPFDAPELPELVTEALASHEGTAAFRLSPRSHGTDGFFVQSLIRRSLDARG